MQDQRLEWLRPKIDKLFELKTTKEAQGKDFNSSIQSGREYRNPRICEKLIEVFNIKEYGTNFSKDRFDPEYWTKKQDAHYDSSRFRRLVEQREREKISRRA